MRQPGVEPGAKAWEASMLPIHHWRFPCTCWVLSVFVYETLAKQKVYSRGGLNSRPSACKADVITTRLLELSSRVGLACFGLHGQGGKTGDPRWRSPAPPKKVEEQGIDPCASCMQSTRSTI